jgi:hypothetical protein
LFQSDYKSLKIKYKGVEFVFSMLGGKIRGNEGKCKRWGVEELRS